MENNNVVNMETKELKVKELKFNDAYKAAAILKNIPIDISEEQMKDLGDDTYKVGMNIMKNMVAESGKAQKEINDFLGHMFGITGEEFGDLSLKQSIKCFKQISELEDLNDFFDLVGSLMK